MKPKRKPARGLFGKPRRKPSPGAQLAPGASTPSASRATWDTALRTPAIVALDPDFLRFAACFDVHPVRLAERLLASFVRRRPRILEITAIPFPPPPSRRR